MCKAPMARIETWERYTNKQGGISYKAKFIPWADAEKMPNVMKKYKKVDMVPCGQCLECKLARARKKATQVWAEYQTTNQDQAWFLTLTYETEHLPEHTTVNTETGEVFTGISLSKEDAQKWQKRMNYFYPKFRYMTAGEYGELNGRPHLHSIIFNVPIDDLEETGEQNQMGQKYFKSKKIEEIWGKGMVRIGHVSFDSINYVARYLEKKIYGEQAKWYYGSKGKIPEFIMQSTKPPLGWEYYQKNKDKIYETDTIYIATDKNLKEFKPSKSWDKMYDLENHEAMERIKTRRRLRAQAMEKARLSKTEKEAWEVRKDNCNRLERHFKNIRKEL